MTPSTSLTLGGFFQGLHGNMVGLIGSLILILIALFLVRWFISKSASQGDLDVDSFRSARSWANGIAGVCALVTIVGFGLSAATYATNTIPRTGLDRSSITQDMKANIKP